MRSTWLLIKSLRIHLIVGLVLSVAWSVLLGAIQSADPNDPILLTNPFYYSSILFAIGLLVILFGQLPRRLHNSPFPLSPRQLAWIPMGFLALFWLAGNIAYLAILLMGALVGHIPFAYWLSLMMMTVYLLPLYALIVSATQGPLYAQSWGFSLIFPLLIFSQVWFEWAKPMLAKSYHIGWPGILGLAVLLFLAAPTAAAATDRSAQFVNRYRNTPAKTTTDAVNRPYLAVLFVEAFGNGLVILGLFAYIFGFGRTLWREFNGTAHFAAPLWFFIAGATVAILLIAIISALDYLRIRASGFSHRASAALLAIRATLVLAPFTRLLGVKSGQPIRCRQCGQNMFVWQPVCGYCGAGATAKSGPGLTWKEAQRAGKVNRPLTMRLYNKGGHIVRFILVSYLVGAAIFSYNSDFRAGYVQISLETIPSEVDRNQVLANIRKTFESESIPWLKSVWPAEAERNRYPRRCDITINVVTPNRLGLCCICPHWEQPDALVQDLALDLIARLQDKYLLMPQPVDSSNRLFISLFNVPRLDGHIDWRYPNSRSGKKRP